MRYRMDDFLRSEFEESIRRLSSSDNTLSNETDRIIADLLKGYFELGFDAGCKASSIYSNKLRELYSPVVSKNNENGSH